VPTSPSTPCPDEQWLRRFSLGDLPEAEGQRIELHLAGCARCVHALETLHADDRVRDALRVEPPVEEPRVVQLTERMRLLWLAPTAALAPLGPAAAKEIEGLLDPPGGPGELGRVGSYRVLQVLGVGGAGVVFLARQHRPQRLVALKVLPPWSGIGGQRLTRFRDEAEVIARLEHPNIVKVFEVGEHQGRPCYAMEYLKGGSLAHKLSAAPLAPRDAAALVETLARAVQYAHAHGILHRDLKPANVLLGAEGQAKVTDFGLAKQLETDTGAPPLPRTESGTILGTPAYMAPEQAAGHAVGPGADVYSLGAILYECLTGRPPFRAASPLQTLDLVRSQDPVPPARLQPGLPRDLQTICLKCLEKDPARRYSSAAALADDLGRFLRHEPIVARPVSARERLWKWAQRKPAVAVLVGVCGALLVVLIAGAVIYQEQLRAGLGREKASAAAARRQQRRADANYQHARETVQRMLKRLEDRVLGGTPRLKELQRQQLEDALAFYQEVLQDLDDPDPAVRFDAAQAYQQTGTAQMLLGRPALAEDNLDRARRLLEALLADDADRPDCQARLVACHNALSRCLSIGRPAQAREHLYAALGLCQRLAAAHPDVAAWQRDLAVCYHNVGTFLQATDPQNRGVPEYLQAVAIRTPLVRDNPADDSDKGQLAGDCMNLGLAYYQTNCFAEAESTFRKAEELLDPLARAHPEQPDYALSLAGVYVNWALVPGAGTDRAAQMLARLDRAVALAEGVLRQEPEYEDARARVIMSRGQRAYAYQHLGRWADAVTDWDRVIEFVEGPKRRLRQSERVLAQARAGDHARAAQEADALGNGPTDPEALPGNLACVYSRCIESVRADSRLSPQRKAALAEEYGARGVAQLCRLQAQGYFKEPRHVAWLQIDDDLEALRARDDFRALLRHIEEAAPRTPVGPTTTGPSK
jgi:tetratricopeptide (TPR) repeat protein